ncbi:MAG: NIPSNAP family protein [Achromobacter sp.]|uniref:NIPSNAP family protein n=1 Tax=Achromobacter sp. TaxID=134375 RepID=UPI003CFCD72E
MIIEHRIYTLPHGGMDAYLARYRELALPLQMKHLGRLLGFFVSDIGTLNQVLHIWAYDSMADREARRAALDADPDWQEFKRGNRGTFVAQQVSIWRAAPFSPRLV